MWVLYVLPAHGFKQAQQKIYNYKFVTIAPFVVYANFEFNFEPPEHKKDDVV